MADFDYFESAKAALAAQDDLRTITDTVPALISFFDHQHVCRFANAHHLKWYGRSPEELIGLHMRDFLGEEGYKLRQPYLARVATGEQVSFDARVPHRDGSLHDAAIRYVPKFGAEGFLGFYILVFDIAHHQHRFRSVFDGMAVSFWELDFSGVTELLVLLRGQGVTDLRGHLRSNPGFIRKAMEATRIIDVNDKTLSLFRFSDRSQVTGSVSPYWPLASEGVYADSLFASLSRQPSFEAETVLLAADGHPIDVLFTCAFPQGGGPSSAVTVGIVDISQRVKGEQALAKVQADLAHAARVSTLGELTASIAHEVNQPLAAIVTNGEAGLRWLNRADPNIQEATVAIERMIEEGNRASEIIARIRAMAVKGETDRTAFCPNQMLSDAVKLVQRQLSASGVGLTMDLTPGLPDVLADRIQLQQVAVNLIVNAGQAMVEQDGADRNITLRTRAQGEAILIEVADTGPGIDADKAARLFNAFYTTKPTGMGMGLSIAKSIVEAHGGEICAVPAEPRGASFRFTIPAHTQV